MTEEDRALLEHYGREGCEEAFAELVRRHIDLVWGTANRVTGDAEMAGEVAQSVFHDLARKARFIPSAASIPGWLYRAATMAARNALRANMRRLRRERMAVDTHYSALPAAEAGDASLERLMPMLDAGLQTIPEKDREVVVLRFFARKSLAEIGSALAISEDAAQKRVSRALERLKSFFERQGVIVPAGGIASAVAGASCAAAGAKSLAGAVVSLLEGVGEQIAFMKTKIVVAGLATVAVSSLKRDRADMAVATWDLEAFRAENASLAERRQLAAEWQQHQRDQEELARLRDETKRLRAAAAVNHDLQRQLAEAKRSYETAQAAARFASDTVQAEQLREQTVLALKHLGRAANLYASREGRFPRNFDEMKNEIGNVMPGNMWLGRFEFAQPGRSMHETEGEFPLLREKEPRKLPTGKWTKAYTLTNGSVRQQEADSPDFSAWENDPIARKEEQTSP